MAGRGARITFQDKDLQKRLKELADKFDKRTKKAILRKGATIVAKQLRQDTPSDTGSLKKTVKPMTWSRTEDYFASFSAKSLIYNPDKQKAIDPFYAAFLNEGWQHTWLPRPKGAQKKGTQGAMTRKITKHKNFIERATQKASPAVVEKVKTEVIKTIQRR
jgi:HK97 gp10 family phage protein